MFRGRGGRKDGLVEGRGLKIEISTELFASLCVYGLSLELVCQFTEDQKVFCIHRHPTQKTRDASLSIDFLVNFAIA